MTGMGNWKFAFASAIGNGHIAENIPCQDFCAVEDHGDFTISVVCDGAGSCEHARLGAQQVAQSCLFRFNAAIRTNNWHKAALPETAAWQKVVKQTLYSVKEDLENYSIASELPFKSLSCTVIVVITLNDGLLVTHIGDGRAGYLNAADEWHALITPFHGSEANETVFITSDIWSDDIIDTYLSADVVAGEVKAFCLLSDGCEKAAFECNLYDAENEVYYDPNRPFPLFFKSNIDIIPKLFENGLSQDEVNTNWQAFLAGGNETLKTESDDKTLILAVKTNGGN